MDNSVSGLTRILNLKKIDDDCYQGIQGGESFSRVYGGLVLAQAVMAAYGDGIDDRSVHSLHAHFLEAGDVEQPIVYRVHNVRQGRSFAIRQIDALQGKRTIFRAHASLHIAEEGPTHQMEMPEVPHPEELMTEEEAFVKYAEESKIPPEKIAEHQRERHVEVRTVNPVNGFKRERAEPYLQVWMRPVAPLPDGRAYHQAALAYMSDWLLLDTCTYPHGLSWFLDEVQLTSLDHGLWLHQDFRADQWLLFSQDSPIANSARGFNRGLVFTQSSRQLVASITQEALIRTRP